MKLIFWLSLVWISGFLMGVCVSGRSPDKRVDDWDRGDWEGCGVDTERSVAEAALTGSSHP